jgi:hypothetical protein
MKKIKIGIITVSRTFNFGAELQTFALQHKLNQLGYDAEVIDYLYYKNKRHKASNKSAPELNFTLKEKIKKKILYYIVGPIIDTCLPIIHKNTKKKTANFKLFHEHYTKFSREFRSIEELYEYNHSYDVYISGSDQVWNPATYSSLKPYLLDFVPEGKKRIAYAASFGVSEVSESYIKAYSTLFKKMDCILVREQQGKELVRKIAQKQADVVLDPTLLLNKKDWKAVTPNVNIQISKPYLLIYDLHPSIPLLQLTEILNKEMGLRVYRLCKRAYGNPKDKNITNIEDAGPAEFIAMFMNASYVLTNSFHGTVFSTNFNIPFHAVLNPDRKNNSRITDFLALTGLSDRIIWEDKTTKQVKTTCEFEQANNSLIKLRTKSINHLKQSL